MISGKCESTSYSSRKHAIIHCPKNASHRVIFRDDTEKLVCKYHAVAYRNRIGQPDLTGLTVISVVTW